MFDNAVYSSYPKLNTMDININHKANGHWSVKLLLALEAIAFVFIITQIVKHLIK